MKYDKKIVAAYFDECGIPAPTFEHRFHPVRRWRFDLAWENEKLALEVQGGLFKRGRHTNGAALIKEYEKLSNAAILGWRILYCQPNDLCMSETVDMIKSALKK